MAKKSKPDFTKLATDTFNDTRGKPALVEDDVSLCQYISRQYGVELTLKQAEQVRAEMDRIEHEEAMAENKVSVVVVMDCRTADPFNPNNVIAFKDTIRGKQLAEEFFREWVNDARDGQEDDNEVDETTGRDDIDNPPDTFDMDQVVSDGLYEIGEGFIAMFETNQ